MLVKLTLPFVVISSQKETASNLPYPTIMSSKCSTSLKKGRFRFFIVINIQSTNKKPPRSPLSKRIHLASVKHTDRTSVSSHHKPSSTLISQERTKLALSTEKKQHNHTIITEATADQTVRDRDNQPTAIPMADRVKLELLTQKLSRQSSGSLGRTIQGRTVIIHLAHHGRGEPRIGLGPKHDNE